MAVRITLIEFFNILKKLFELDQNVLTQILWIYVFLFHFLSELYWRGCVNNEIYLRANSTIHCMVGYFPKFNNIWIYWKTGTITTCQKMLHKLLVEYWKKLIHTSMRMRIAVSVLYWQLVNEWRCEIRLC